MQTLEDSITIIAKLSTEQMFDPKVYDAQAEGVCPALVELVCEALQSLGREPRLFVVCQRLALEFCAAGRCPSSFRPWRLVARTWNKHAILDTVAWQM